MQKVKAAIFDSDPAKRNSVCGDDCEDAVILLPASTVCSDEYFGGRDAACSHKVPVVCGRGTLWIGSKMPSWCCCK